MKKFKFRFETVSRVKKIQRDHQVKNFVFALNRVLNAQKQIQALLEQTAHSLEEVRKGLKRETLDPWFLSAATLFRKKLDILLQKKKEEGERLLHKLEEERKKLLNVEAQKKTFEILKEKDIEKYREEIKKYETKEMDEVGRMRSCLLDASHFPISHQRER